MKGVTCRQKFIGYVEEQQELFLKDACKPAMDTIVLIGPEGDFSRQEFDEALETDTQQSAWVIPD
jgi:16S rRNA (uracil1498-N3)-methyltransferase